MVQSPKPNNPSKHHCVLPEEEVFLLVTSNKEDFWDKGIMEMEKVCSKSYAFLNWIVFLCN